MKKYVDRDKLAEFAQKLHAKQKTIFATKNEVGAPLVASLAADMTDTNKIYVYVGSEAGMTAGNWYYYNGSAWVSGGVYNSTAFETDETLSIAGAAADAKAVGDALAEKADTDGDYPDMSVGEAGHASISDLAAGIETDREIEDAEEACPPIVFGTVGGNAEVQSGYNRFEELRGNTIKWNQLINPAYFPSTRTINGITFTNNGDGTVTVSGTATDTAYIDAMSAVGKKIVGHKYLLRGCPVGGNASNGYRMYDNGESPYKYDVGDGVIYTAAVADDGGIYISISSGTVISTPITFKPNYFDLTDIYGAGNEPSTVAEFVRDFSLPFYGYSVRTLLSAKSASLISRGKNQFPGLDTFGRVVPGLEYEISGISAGGYVEEYDGEKNLIKTSPEITETTDITLTDKTVYAKIQATTYTNIMWYVLWSTPGESYEPPASETVTLPNIELRSAGSAYDVLYQQGGGKRRIGSYTFTGNETFSPYGGGYYFNSAQLSQTPKLPTMNVICPVLHPTVTAISVQTDTSAIHFNENGYIYIGTSPADLVGVTMYYELATETDITTTENPGWDEYLLVDNFGTLEFTADPAQTPQVPQAYFVRYTVNLVEFLDSLFVEAGGDAGGIALKSDLVIPDAPTTDGTYTLKVTVASGIPTYSWVLDE